MKTTSRSHFFNFFILLFYPSLYWYRRLLIQSAIKLLGSFKCVFPLQFRLVKVGGAGIFRRTWSRATPVKTTLSRKKKFCRINHKVVFTRFHGTFGKVSCESFYHIFAFLLASSIAWCTVWLLLKHANATTDITFYYNFIFPHPSPTPTY